MFFQMVKKILYVVLLVLFSCRGEATKEQVDGKIPRRESCNPSANPDFLGYIKSDGIGIVRIGESIPTFRESPQYEIQAVDQIVPQEDGSQKIQKVYHVYYNMGEVMFLEVNSIQPNQVFSITTFSPYYYLENCIHVGSSIEDLMLVAGDLEVMLNYDDNMLYVVQRSSPSIVFMLPADFILDFSKIDEATGITDVSNVNNKGKIISIKVQV